MPANLDYNDWTHVGNHSFQRAPTVPDGSFGDAQISTANPITAPKLQHQYDVIYSQLNGVAAASERKVVHVARSAGSVAAFEAGPVTIAAGAATVTLDLRKNGTSILTGVITLTSAHAAYNKVAGALNPASVAYALGDVFEVVTVATAGGGTLPQGVFADAVFREGSG